MSAFRVQDVTVRLGTHLALREVSFDVESGEAVALVGPSGAGKTTLLRVLNGMIVPEAGRASRDGRDLNSLSGRDLRRIRSRIGWIPQDHGLVPELRVLQNVAAGRAGRRSTAGLLRDVLLPSRGTVGTILDTLDRVGIGDLLYQRTDRLSGGEQQRVAIARALYQTPDALLADEPVASVDPARARDTLERLLALAREDGLTLLVSLHDVELARTLFPRIIGLRDGRIRFDREPARVGDEDLAALYGLTA